MWVKGVHQKDLRAVDCQLRAKDLCRNLIDLLFTEDDLRVGNATEARTSGVNLLDSHILYAIRGSRIIVLCILSFLPLSSALSLPFP